MSFRGLLVRTKAYGPASSFGIPALDVPRKELIRIAFKAWFHYDRKSRVFKKFFSCNFDLPEDSGELFYEMTIQTLLGHSDVLSARRLSSHIRGFAYFGTKLSSPPDRAGVR